MDIFLPDSKSWGTATLLEGKFESWNLWIPVFQTEVPGWLSLDSVKLPFLRNPHFWVIVNVFNCCIEFSQVPPRRIWIPAGSWTKLQSLPNLSFHLKFFYKIWICEWELMARGWGLWGYWMSCHITITWFRAPEGNCDWNFLGWNDDGRVIRRGYDRLSLQSDCKGNGLWLEVKFMGM